MSETGIKGIVLDNIPLNVMTVAFMRKLDKFDCAVVMDEQGGEKYAKAQLAVLDAVIGAKAPSVLIITDEKLMYEWYAALLKGIGADFKFITADPDSINYFSPKLESLYITNTGAGDNPLFGKIKESELIWDLVIIDGGLSREGIDTERILDGFDLKTKKLVIFATYLNSGRNAAEKLAELPVKFLSNDEKAEYFRSHFPDTDIINFSLSSPYSRYYGSSGLIAPKIKTIGYTVDKEALKAKAEQNNTRTYRYGGNIFEELTLDVRKLYNAEKYDDEIVNGLRKADTKLDSYIKELAELSENSENRIITYFSSEKTLEYVYKALLSSMPALKHHIAVKKSGIHRIDDTARYFEPEKTEEIRILLSTDNQDEQCDRFDVITHIINYELPTNPLTLHRRYKQAGIKGFENPEFIVFRDETDIFDGRMIRKALALHLCSSFTMGIPGRNVFLHMVGLENILADLLSELGSIEEMNAAEINLLASDCNIKESGQNARTELIKARRDIRRAFGLPDEKTSRDTAADIIGKRLEVLRKGCCFFDSEGKLQAKSYAFRENNDYADLETELKSGESFRNSRSTARKLLKSCKTSQQLYKAIHSADEHDRQYIYFCTWRYLARNRLFEGGYNKFLKDIFEEAI